MTEEETPELRHKRKMEKKKAIGLVGLVAALPLWWNRFPIPVNIPQ